jgi:hypothetical protein
LKKQGINAEFLVDGPPVQTWTLGQQIQA